MGNGRIVWVLLTSAWLASGVLAAQTSPAGVPFRQGEVAVYAAPNQLAGLQVVKFLPHAGISVVAVENGRELGLVQRLRQAGLRAGLNLQAEAFQVNDPLYSYQWHMPKVQSDQAWGISRGQNIIVAVLDTGLAVGGPDGIGCVVSGYDVVNQDDDPHDGDGHGTHVAGTIAQATSNGVGVTGLAHGACIMPVKVLDDGGSGSFADIADGIYYAFQHGASVINMSLGTSARFNIRTDPIMDPALDAAYTAGATVVCAAGNDGSRSNVSYPAIYPTTIAVGATDYRNVVPRYSNRGAGLDLVAPGGDVGRDDNRDGYGDGVLQETFYNGSWGYWFFQGTSMASPHVAAAAALLYSQDSTLTPDEVRTLLTSTALDLGEVGYDSTSGWGLLQAYAALTGGGSGGGCTDKDGDGFCVENGDCNDADPSTYPGANDTKGRPGRNGVDNDCDGIIDG